MANGIGKNTPAEVMQFAKDQLRALSVILGDKDYFFGDIPTTVPAFMLIFKIVKISGRRYSLRSSRATRLHPSIRSGGQEIHGAVHA